MSAAMNSVNLAEAKEVMLSIIGHAFQANVIPQNIMLHGPMGVGKSSIIRQLAKDLEVIVGKPVEIIDVRLISMEASEVNGIPHNAETGEMIAVTVNGETKTLPKKVMVHSTPSWFPTDDSKFYILFFDEITNCGIDIQHAAYRPLLDRDIQNGSRLPDTCAIIAAGNRKKDKTGAKRLLPAAANRFGCHLEIDADRLFDSFLEYAVQKRFHRSIIGYLNWRQASLFVNDGESDAFATPRSWEFADSHMKNEMLEANERLLDIAIAGAIGTATAVDFAGFREYDGRLPNFKAIRQGKETYEMPEGDEGLKYAISSSLAMELLDVLRIKDAKQAGKEINNLMPLLDEIPKELRVVMFKTMASDPVEVRKIFSYPELQQRYREVASKLKQIK